MATVIEARSDGSYFVEPTIGSTKRKRVEKREHVQPVAVSGLIEIGGRGSSKVDVTQKRKSQAEINKLVKKERCISNKLKRFEKSSEAKVRKAENNSKNNQTESNEGDEEKDQKSIECKCKVEEAYCSAQYDYDKQREGVEGGIGYDQATFR